MNNRMNGGSLWELIYPLIAYTGIIWLVQFLGMILAMAFAVVSIKESGGMLEYYRLMDETIRIADAYTYEMSLAAALLAIPAELYFLKRDEAARAGAEPVYEKTASIYLPIAFLLGAFSCIAINNMMNIAGLFEMYEQNMEEVAANLYRGKLVIEILGIVLVTPILEELLFRGIIQQRVRFRTNANMAIVISALLFGFYHGNLLQLIYAGILGLIIAYVYEKYHSLAAAILVHMGANLISVIGTESSVLDPLYQTDTMLIVGTIVWCALVFGCIYIVHYHVEPKVIREPEGEPGESR